jgi:hypothetical protein
MRVSLVAFACGGPCGATALSHPLNFSSKAYQFFVFGAPVYFIIDTPYEINRRARKICLHAQQSLSEEARRL